MQLWGFARLGNTSAKAGGTVASRPRAEAHQRAAQPQTAVTRSYGSSDELHEAQQEMRKQGWYLISAWGEPDGRVVALWATRNKRLAA